MVKIYINNLINLTSNPCYADHSTLHGAPSRPNNQIRVASLINIDLNYFEKWIFQNLVNFNASKT